MIRHASIADLNDIDRIYNQAIKHGFQTAHTEPLTQEERVKWFDKYSKDSCPLCLYEKNNKVIGWISISPIEKDVKL